MGSKDLVYTSIFTDMMSEGFIVIDTRGVIKIYNEVAKEIFGLKNKSKISHSSGRLAEGDLLIIVNNALAGDDGNMDGDSLRLLGLEGDEVEPGQAFLLVSRYKGENLGLEVGSGRSLELKKSLYGIDLDLDLDYNRRRMNIRINQIDFPLNYTRAIGHLVALDGQTKELKFYQTYGYTAREESINDLLQGASYKKKTVGIDDLDVIGRPIFEIHRSESLIEDFYRLARGADIRVENKFEEINGFPTLCSLKPVDIGGRRIGAALKVEDISQIESVIRERDSILRELEEASRKINKAREVETLFADFVGREASIVQVKELAYRASRNLSNVLITGEKGVGKTLLARKIHQNSSFKSQGLIHINSVNAGADRLREAFEKNRGMTIYLDEISRLDLEAQEVLLDLLETYKDRELRLLASSSENLDRRIMEGGFSERLYYAINILPIYIPPLRERRLDIRNIVDQALPRICRDLNVEEKRISAEALELIENYSWPDNVRELINVLERAVTLSLGSVILTKHIVLLKDIKNVDKRPKTLKQALEEREKTIIQSTLSSNKGDRKKTIRDLGISQSTFYEKLNKYDIK